MARGAVGVDDARHRRLRRSQARAGAALNLDLLHEAADSVRPANAPRGCSNAIAGTLVIVGLATAIALPVGILVAIYLNEFAPPHDSRDASGSRSTSSRHAVDRHRHLRLRAARRRPRAERDQRGVRTRDHHAPVRRAHDQEVLRSSRTSFARPSLALGIPRWRTTLGIVLPRALGGIVTGTSARRRPRGRRDRAAALHIVDRRDADDAGPDATAPDDPVGDLRAIGVARSDGPRPRLGGGFILLLFVLLASLAARWLRPAAAQDRRPVDRKEPRTGPDYDGATVNPIEIPPPAEVSPSRPPRDPIFHVENLSTPSTAARPP